MAFSILSLPTLPTSAIPSLNTSILGDGILPVLRGGSGVSTKTGTGDLVLSANATLTGSTACDIITAATRLAVTTDSASAPGHTWSSDTSTGLYRSTTNTIGVAAGGTPLCTMNASRMIFENGKNLSWKNDGGTPTNVLRMDNTNVTKLLSGGGGMYINPDANGSPLMINYNNTGGNITTYSGTTAVISQVGQKVGIGLGATAPSAPLQVTGGAINNPSQNGIYVYNPTNTAGNHAVVGTQVAGTSAGNPYISWGVDNVRGWAMGIDNADSQKLKIRGDWAFSAADVMTFSGNYVGIGTTSPTAPLHVKGGATNIPTQNGVFVYNPTNTAVNHAVVGTRVAGSSAGNAFVSWDVEGVAGWSMGIDTADSQKLKIRRDWTFSTNDVVTLSGTFVGIGTTTPRCALDVNGACRISSTISARPGNLGPTILLQWNTYRDLGAGNTWWAPQEAGNPVDINAAPNAYTLSGSKLGNDPSGEGTSFGAFRFIFRAAPATGASSSYTLQPVQSREAVKLDIGSSFTINSMPSWYGYLTYISPWLDFVYFGDRNGIGMTLTSVGSGGGNFRIGTVMMQFC